MTPGNESPGNAPPDWRQLRDERRLQHAQWRIRRAQERARWRSQHPGGGRIAPGLLLLVFGIVFLLNNLGVFDLHEVRMYWPVLLIVVGAFHAISARHGSRSVLWSGALITMGGLLLAQNFGYIRGNMWEIIWPVLLIFLGLSFLLRGGTRMTGCAGTPPWGTGSPAASSTNRLNEEAMFGGIKQRIDSQEFEGGYLSSVFGGIEVDLRQANTKLDELVIEADAVFGGIELTLPDRWNVTVRGTGIFGGYENQTHPPANPAEKRPHLTVTGHAVFGGVSVKN